MPDLRTMSEPNIWFVIGVFVVCWGIVGVSCFFKNRKKKQ